jgi:hypothetical protein
MLVVSGSRMSMGSKWPEYGAQMISFGRQGRGSVARWGSGVGVARTRILAPFSRAAACGPGASPICSPSILDGSTFQQGCKQGCTAKLGSEGLLGTEYR